MAVRQKTLLAISQVYLPDPAAVGMHVADACAEMARRGHHVRVLTRPRLRRPVAALCAACDRPRRQLLPHRAEMGARAREVVARDYDRDLLLGRFADLIEQRLGLLDPR